MKLLVPRPAELATGLLLFMVYYSVLISLPILTLARFKQWLIYLPTLDRVRNCAKHLLVFINLYIYIYINIMFFSELFSITSGCYMTV